MNSEKQKKEKNIPQIQISSLADEEENQIQSSIQIMDNQASSRKVNQIIKNPNKYK